MRSDLCGAMAVVRQKSHWIITMNGKMNVWRMQKIEIPDLKPFLAGENTSVLIILVTTVLPSSLSYHNNLNIQMFRM